MTAAQQRGKSSWRRVSREKPCAVCGKPDWCLGTEDGTVAICARIESPHRIGESGWLHRLADANRPPGPLIHSRQDKPPRADLGELAGRWSLALTPSRLQQIGADLGVSQTSLRAFGAGWASCQALSIPMRDSLGQITGIRLRFPNGDKRSVRGSREGLFIPRGFSVVGQSLHVAEGASDAAALFSLGFSCVIGRPSCASGNRLLADLVRRERPASVVIWADADPPGQRGAESLAKALLSLVPVRVATPGAKDARAWMRDGAGRKDFERAVVAAPLQLRAVGRGNRLGRQRHHHKTTILTFSVRL